MVFKPLDMGQQRAKISKSQKANAVGPVEAQLTSWWGTEATTRGGDSGRARTGERPLSSGSSGVHRAEFMPKRKECSDLQSLLSRLSSDYTCMWGSFQKEVVKDPIRLRVTAPRCPTDWIQCLFPPTTVENLIAHSPSTFLRRVMAKTRGKLALDNAVLTPLPLAICTASKNTTEESL